MTVPYGWQNGVGQELTTIDSWKRAGLPLDSWDTFFLCDSILHARIAGIMRMDRLRHVVYPVWTLL